MNRFRFCLPFLVILFFISIPLPSRASEPDTLYAEGRYVMGDRDTREDARQYALLDAKRKVMEQVGTFLQSRATVENYTLTEQEIQTYSGGLIKTEIIEERWEPVGETMAAVVRIRAIVDPEQVQKEIEQMRQESEVQEQLHQLQSDYQRVVAQLDSLKANQGGAEDASSTAAESGLSGLREERRTQSWDDLQRLELLIQIVTESNRPRPDLPRLQRMVDSYLNKYPAMLFVNGYLGIGYFKHGQMQEAIRYLEMAVKETPERRLKRLSRPLVQQLKNRYQKEQALFHYYLARAYYQMGKRREALKNLRLARKLDPGNVRYQQDF